MKVINGTTYPLIAFGWHLERGYGSEVTINPGESAEVSGPYLGEMGGGDCHIAIEGEITCQEGPDDDKGFQVVLGGQLNLKSDNVGITVRHHSESRKIRTAA